MIWSAFILGLGGSLHCVGMCGPIAMALPISAETKRKMLWQAILYQLGRVCTYTFLGVSFGMLGWGVALAGYQKTFSLVLGISILAFLLCMLIGTQTTFRPLIQIQKMFGFQRYIAFVKQKMGKALAKPNSTFQVGLLTGLLPCGLVYVALAGSLAISDPWMGGLYMAIFGLGTAPLMTLLMAGHRFLPRSVNQYIRKLTPAFLFAFALILIWRGMALELPRTLEFWESTRFPIMCH